MPRGFVLLHRSDNNKPHRVSVSAIGWYMKHGVHPFTVVTLLTRSEGDNEMLTVRESEEEIDALIEQAQITSDIKTWGSPQASDFATAMGEAVQAFGGGR